MANIKSALKRMHQDLGRREVNRSEKTRMRTAVKKVRQAVEQGNGDLARELLPGTLSLIDRTAQKNVIHPNAAARTKSRLERAVAKLSS